MAVEVVVLVPVLVMIMVLVVAFGRYVSVEGDTEAAAREGARAASLERDLGSATAAARRAVEASTPGTLDCTPAVLRGAFAPGGVVTVDLTCEVSLHNLGLIGLRGTVQVTGSSSAPLDQYRRMEG